MKKLLILLFSILISFNSYGGWKKVGEDGLGDWYLDKKLIRERSGYVYWWSLSDWVVPTAEGYMSFKVYKQGDCRTNRFKSLQAIWYNQPMAEGEGDVKIFQNEWSSPTTYFFDDLKAVCKYVD